MSQRRLFGSLIEWPNMTGRHDPEHQPRWAIHVQGSLRMRTFFKLAVRSEPKRAGVRGLQGGSGDTGQSLRYSKCRRGGTPACHTFHSLARRVFLELTSAGISLSGWHRPRGGANIAYAALLLARHHKAKLPRWSASGGFFCTADQAALGESASAVPAGDPRGAVIRHLMMAASSARARSLALPVSFQNPRPYCRCAGCRC